MSLRPYQIKLRKDIEQAWEEGANNVLAVLPTGGGKTRTFSDIILAQTMARLLTIRGGASIAIAHRQELVSQISMALNRDKVKHRIIAPPKVIKACVRLHMEDQGYSFYDITANCAVAGVDTLILRSETWFASVRLWVQDEAHHVLRENKWGKAAALFPNAKGLGVTATPVRADGKGLGSHHDGLMDAMVVGPSMRDLIRAGYLVDYSVYAPPSDLDLGGVAVSDTTGDYNREQMVKAVRGSHILGDVVTHYLRIANGKRGITFAPDIQTATELSQRFNDAGVPAMVVTSKSTDLERYHAVRDLASGKLKQLVNVDLFGEGVDVPAVEVVSFARPTASYSLFIQQSGRALRLLLSSDVSAQWELLSDEERRFLISVSAKPKAIIIDHVGNILRHGLPDAPKTWTLDRREKRAGKVKDPDLIPVTACPDCTLVYEKIYRSCPHCGYTPVPQVRSAPEFVDGDLVELDEATLARMRGEIAAVDMSLEDKRLELAMKHVPLIGQKAGVNRHAELQAAQTELRSVMAWWGGWQTSMDRSVSEQQRRFYFRYGIDVFSAMALRTKEALELKERIALDIPVNLGYDVVSK